MLKIIVFKMGFDSEKSFIMAERLKQLREGKGLSHEKLSKTLLEQYDVKVSADSLMNYEVADANHTKALKNQGMRVEYLRCFADFFAVSTDYLLGLTNVKTPSADTQAIVSQTGLNEENAIFLSALKTLNQDIRSRTNLDNIDIISPSPGPHIDFINDLVSIVSEDDSIFHYLMMKACLDIPAPVSWSSIDFSNLSDEDLAVLTGAERQFGYVHFTGQDAFEYHCAQIATKIEAAIKSKYIESARWRESNGID